MRNALILSLVLCSACGPLPPEEGDEVVESVFVRPRARPRLAAVATSQNIIDVHTEDELLAALTSLPRGDDACYGRAINIVSDITLTRTVTLSTQHAGLTITSSSRARLATASALTRAFSISASDILIENLVLTDGFSATTLVRSFADRLHVTGISVSSTATITNLIDASLGPFGLTVTDCVVANGGPSVVLVLGGGAPLTSGVVSGNRNFGGGLLTIDLSGSVVTGNAGLGGWTNAGTATCANVAVTGNRFTGDIVLTGALSSNVSITGNAMGGNDIDTVLTAGSNSIVGNTNVGTITADATDAVTSNT
jgi:hypothetical protein